MTRILLIEDDDDLREDIVGILELTGFEIIEAGDGATGVKYLYDFLPDLVICDYMMPNKNGDWVLSRLRSDPLTKSIPFIYLTAKTSRESMRKGMEMGANDYITKPFTPQELISAIETQMKKQEALAEQHERVLEGLRENVVRALPHELRTPLTSIIGYARMLVEGADTFEPAQIEQMAAGIKRSALRLRRLIENYFLFAQLELLSVGESETEDLAIAPLTDPCRTVDQIIQASAEETGRGKDILSDCHSASILMSENNLKKIVYELLDNALKFSAPGNAVRLNMSVRDGLWEFKVIDEGRGMSAEQIANIGAYMQFERRVYEHAGLGLGLAIVSHLARIHNGEFALQSSPEGGTQATVRIPVSQN